MASSSPSSSTTTPLSDSNWPDRDHAIPFRHMIALKPHSSTSTSSSTVFTSLSAGYPPTPTPRTYGGHVFAQAGWAAAHTVPFGMHLHSITGYFLELGDTRYAFRYVVRKVRTGGIYALRYVEVYQDAGEATKGANGKGVLCFASMVGFKRDEAGKHKPDSKGRTQRRAFEHQELPKDWLEKEYGVVLAKKKRFEEWPVCQGMDGLWSDDMSVREWKQRGDAFPGLEMRKVDMRGYNPDKVPMGGVVSGDDGSAAKKWRLLVLYRLVDDREDGTGEAAKQKKTGADDVINLHACAHLYASDRNSLFLAQRALGFQNVRGQMGSLSHTVNFHGYAKEWLMVDEQTGRPKEYIQESWISNSGADRVTHNSRLWDKQTGKIIASTVQDGMMRMPTGNTQKIVDGDAIVRREAKL